MSSEATRDQRPATPLLVGSRRVFDLALSGMVFSRRGLLAGCLVGLPLILAVSFRWFDPSGTTWGAGELYRWIVASYLVGNVLPLVALFYASGIVGDEVEGRTLVYLLTRPVSRTSILLGRLAAFVVAGLALTAPVLLLSLLLLFETAPGAVGLPLLARDMAVAALTLVVYGALFTLLGVALRRPMLPGVLFLYGWELLSHAPGYVPRVTLAAHLRALMPPGPAGTSSLSGLVTPGSIPTPQALVTLLVLTAAVIVFNGREYVPEP